jgi:hypothetical protein
MPGDEINMPPVTPSAGDGGFPHACARASWPRCRALARSTGARCRARGDGRGGLCKNHTGLTLKSGWRPPMPVWELRIATGGLWLAPDRPARTWRRSAWPQRVSWSIAARLIMGGQVTRALLHRKKGGALLRAIRRCGVRVVPEGGDALVYRVRFEVDATEASNRLASWRGKRGVDG